MKTIGCSCFTNKFRMFDISNLTLNKLNSLTLFTCKNKKYSLGDSTSTIS